MNRIENGTCTTDGLNTETHKSFPDILHPTGKIFKAYFNTFIFQ